MTQNIALLYRPAPRWHFVAALAAAIGVHVGMALAAFHEPEKPPVVDGTELVPVSGDWPNDESPPPAPDVAPLETIPEQSNSNDFFDDAAPPRPKNRRSPARPIQKPSAGPGVVSYQRGKTTALSAPRPEYPYECRRAKITGSGVALLTIEAGGRVASAQTIQSTGDSTLDRAAVSAFSRWIFSPNQFKAVRVPVTFTLMGAVY